MRVIGWIAAFVCIAPGVRAYADGQAPSPAAPASVSTPSSAAAATPATPETPAAPDASSATDASKDTGSFDLGGRGTIYSGDPARYNEYRDMSNGLFLENFRSAFESGGWLLTLDGTHAGREDAAYAGEVTRPGRFRLWGKWDQSPWRESDTTESIYQGVGTGVLRIPDYVQSLLQTTPSLISSVVPNATPFMLQSQRRTSTGGIEFMPDTNTTVGIQVMHMDRSGVIPGAASFGFSNAVELPVPVNHHQTDVDANAERAAGRWLFRGGYSASWFRNATPALAFDNPYELTDKTTVSSQGQMALAPDTFSQTVSGAVSVKLPARTRATGTVSLGELTDNTPLLPETVNTAMPTIALDRSTVEGDARTLAGSLTLTSHPLRAVSLDVRYRYFDVDDRTPVFTQTGSRIGYDTTIEPLATPDTSQPFSLMRETFDASANVETFGRTTTGVGYSREDTSNTYRIFSGSNTNTARVTFDTSGSARLALHAQYEHAERRGEGLDTSGLAAIGEQTTLETFDIADRNRNEGTFTASALIRGAWSIDASAGVGKDDYPTNAPGVGLGLASTQYIVYGIGLTATPNDNLTFSVSYDLNDYKSLQWSRSATTAVQAADPTLDWSANGDDRTHSLTGDLDIQHIAGKLRVKLTVDVNRGSTLYLFGLAPVTTLPTPSQLPAVMSDLRRGTIDATYPLASRIMIGVAYWYERYRVSDFSQDSGALTELDLPSLVTMNNVLLPYTAQTISGRLTYRW